MSQLDDLLRDLVVANRILSNEDVVDAYGHISVRHPDNPKRFFMSRSLAPELVERHDLIEFDQAGEPVNDKRQPYLERFIHAAIFESRPDVMAVVHAHAEDTLPFGIVSKPLEPVIHSGSLIGGKGARGKGYKPNAPETWGAWEYWATRAGCGDKIGKPHDHAHKE